MNHRVGQWVFALAVGLLLAFAAYNWASDPGRRAERESEEQVVAAAREELAGALGINNPELVDPVAPNRKVGKAYVYRSRDGWEVSGFYRRHDQDDWHPFLMTLDASLGMTHLKIRDDELLDIAEANPELEVLPGATRKH